jgi:hypothetical protein
VPPQPTPRDATFNPLMSHNADKKDSRKGHSPDHAGTLFQPAYPVVTSSVQKQIGQRLCQLYDSLAFGEKPVPDHFIEIIGRLDQAHPENRS